MIVWGGIGFGGYLNDGARYNPSTNTWTMLPPVPAALHGRTQHTAVWTGSEMIVWGGTAYVNGNSVYYNNGASYNPATNTWKMLASAPGSIKGRIGHSAVWTGTEMLIWGGTDNSMFDDGAQYNPSTDTWELMAPSCLSARYNHRAVWTGTEMIIWGGSYGFPYGDGALYNPVIKKWNPLDSGIGISARSDHSMLWEGKSLIIWGGLAIDDYTNDGAIGNIYSYIYVPIVFRASGN